MAISGHWAGHAARSASRSKADFDGAAVARKWERPARALPQSTHAYSPEIERDGKLRVRAGPTTPRSGRRRKPPGPASASRPGFYNLGNFMRTLALPKAVEHWSLTTLREKLIKIGAKVVSHGRYVTFQLAEVAVPRELFRKILRLIDGLRPAPLPP